MNILTDADLVRAVLLALIFCAAAAKVFFRFAERDGKPHERKPEKPAIPPFPLKHPQGPYDRRSSSRRMVYPDIVTIPKQGAAKHAQAQDKSSFSGTSGSAAFADLVRACFGDKAKAARLVEYEKRKQSGISDSAAAQAALNRLRFDRSR